MKRYENRIDENCWEEVAIEDLRKFHNDQLWMERHSTVDYEPTPVDFDEFVEQMIAEGDLKEVR